MIVLLPLLPFGTDRTNQTHRLPVKHRLWTDISLELDVCLILFSKALLPFRPF